MLLALALIVINIRVLLLLHPALSVSLSHDLHILNLLITLLFGSDELID